MAISRGFQGSPQALKRGRCGASSLPPHGPAWFCHRWHPPLHATPQKGMALCRFVGDGQGHRRGRGQGALAINGTGQRAGWGLRGGLGGSRFTAEGGWGGVHKGFGGHRLPSVGVGV